jgi:hypothetical protein
MSAKIFFRTRLAYIADLIMGSQGDLTMPVVAITFLLMFVTAIFVSRSYSRWIAQQAATPLDPVQQPSAAYELSKTSAYEVSKSLDIPEGWFTDPKVFALERRAIFATVYNPVPFFGVHN